jgi:hypothetical protein
MNVTKRRWLLITIGILTQARLRLLLTRIFLYAARRCVARVRAAFWAARFNPVLPLVRTAFMAAWCRDELPLCRAERFAWRARLLCEAAEWPSRRSAREVARERRADGFRRRDDCPRRRSRCACVRVRLEVFSFLGGWSFTPARRAFESPMAMACLVERAPCLPSRM